MKKFKKKRVIKRFITNNETGNVNYSGYLQTIGFVSILTFLAELIAFLTSQNDYSPLQNTIAVICIISWVAVIGVAFILGTSNLDIVGSINKINSISNRARGRWTVALFFVHMLLVAVYIFLDGGAKTSCISSILLMDASFGFMVANSHFMKWIVNSSCVALYLLTFFVHIDSSGSNYTSNIVFNYFNFEPDNKVIAYLSAIFYVFITNAIINWKIEKNVRSKTEQEIIEKGLATGAGEVSE